MITLSASFDFFEKQASISTVWKFEYFSATYILREIDDCALL